MENICLKQYPTDIANYKQKLVMSVNDKKCIFEHGPCRPRSPFNRDASGLCFDEAFYYTVSKAGLHILRSCLYYSPELHNVTANFVGFLETIVLSTKNGYEDLKIRPIHY